MVATEPESRLRHWVADGGGGAGNHLTVVGWFGVSNQFSVVPVVSLSLLHANP